ncbi:MAG: 50S ribosomal protein L37e [Candidatus Woesearchaeota archaeon]
MTKGTPSMGKHGNSKNHIICRRCGKHSRNMSTGVCAACGYGKSSKVRTYSWKKASKR